MLCVCLSRGDYFFTNKLYPLCIAVGPESIFILDKCYVMILGISALVLVPFSLSPYLVLRSSRPDVGDTYAIIRVCYRPLLADRCETL